MGTYIARVYVALILCISGCSSGGRVHVWGACGRRFKSCHPDKIFCK